MLVLSKIKEMINEFELSGIDYCFWKNNHELDVALAGQDDLDILIRRSDFQQFLNMLMSLGFKQASNRFMQYPFVYHFYSLDEASGKLVHLHLYTKLVTGESHTKNYYLGLDELLLTNTIVDENGIRMPIFEIQYFVFVIRFYIKISCLPGFLLFIRDKASFLGEYEYLCERLSNGIRGSEHVSFFGGYVSNLVREFKINDSEIKHIVHGLKVRRKLKNIRRFGLVSDVFHRYWQIVYRVANKIKFKQKKRLNEGGAVIAITGLDATGKSTTTAIVDDWLRDYFDVNLVHVGRPPSTILTAPVRIALNIYKKVRKKDSNKSPNIDTEIQKMNVLSAFRYLVLAYERFALLRKVRASRDAGIVVICDRYVSQCFGCMDSPRIPISEKNTRLVNTMARIERRYYQQAFYPDLAFKLHLPVEIAIERNAARVKVDKETELELRERYRINHDIVYKAHCYEEIDARESLDTVVAKLKQTIWKSI